MTILGRAREMIPSLAVRVMTVFMTVKGIIVIFLNRILDRIALVLLDCYQMVEVIRLCLEMVYRQKILKLPATLQMI